MTIAGGMVCTDGILVFSDTEWTVGSLKLHRSKHWKISSDRLSGVMTGAGDEHYWRYALQVQNTLLNKIEEPLRVPHFMATLGAALTATYVEINKDPNAKERGIEFIVGVASPDDTPVLVKTSGTAVVKSDNYEYSGSGAWLATYLTGKIFKIFKNDIPMMLGEDIAVYVLSEVKKHMPHCGGETNLYFLRNDDRAMEFRAYGDIRDTEAYFDDFERIIQDVRIKASNPLLSRNEFDRTMKDFVDDMKMYRKLRDQKRKAESAIDRKRAKRQRET